VVTVMTVVDGSRGSGDSGDISGDSRGDSRGDSDEPD
jgi:hypothetical protein